MVSVAQPELPAVPNYPTQGHEEELESALALAELEFSTNEGWEDQGEREGVQLYRKPDPDNAYAVPTVKGSAIISNCTSEAFLSVIQLAGMRKRWDARFESGHMLARYNRVSYAFYTEMKGISWIVYPRDIVGVQKNFRSNEVNGEIMVVQTSIIEDELAPPQHGKTRATLTISGWQLIPQGNDLEVTYVVKIALNGSIPLAMVNMIATETPLCVGKARDVYYNIGHPPYVSFPPSEPETSIIFQTESFSDPGPNHSPTTPDQGELKFNCNFTTSINNSFEIKYDLKMYKNGIDVSCYGEGGGEGIELSDDHNGTVTVRCTADGIVGGVCIEPRGV